MIQSPDTQYPTRLKPQATVLAAAQIDGSFSFSLDLQASLVLIKKSGRLCVQDCADVLEHRPQATHVIRLRLFVWLVALHKGNQAQTAQHRAPLISALVNNDGTPITVWHTQS